MSIQRVLRQNQDMIDSNPQLFIGSLVWFTISTSYQSSPNSPRSLPVRVRPDEIATWFADLDLDQRFLPSGVLTIDAFRSASSAVRERYDLDENFSAELTFVEVKKEREFVIRHLMRATRDRKQERLRYEQVGQLKFFRPPRDSRGVRKTSGHHVQWTKRSGLPELDDHHVDLAMQDFSRRFEAARATVDANTIRAVIRNYLQHLQAVAVRSSGGVYFVGTEHEETLAKLQALVDLIGRGCSFIRCPLVDTSQQRAMIAEALDNDVEEAITRLMRSIAEAAEDAKTRAGGKVNPRKVADIGDQYETILQRKEKYAKKLGLSQARAEASMGMALTAIDDLATLI